MTYYQPLGVTISEAIELGAKAVQDPHLPEFACEVKRLSNIDRGKPAGGPCPRVTATPAQIAQGIGMRHVTGPLRLYIYHRQYPWVFPLAVAALFGATYYMGYLTGKGR
ncbi:MAG: hypothetical protein ACE5LB_13780 [Acidiferrobacterales bacterium]